MEALPTEHLGLLTVQELKARLDRRDDLLVLDARSDREWDRGHIEDARHIYVGYLKDRTNEVPVDQPSEIGSQYPATGKPPRGIHRVRRYESVAKSRVRCHLANHRVTVYEKIA